MNLSSIINIISGGTEEFRAEAKIAIDHGYNKVNVVISRRISEVSYSGFRENEIVHKNHIYLPDSSVSVTDIENITSIDITRITCYGNEYVAPYNMLTSIDELESLPNFILDNWAFEGDISEPSGLHSNLVWRTTAAQY